MQAIYVAMWPFEARSEDEMSFDKGDLFDVLSRNGDWWKARRIDKNGRVLGTGIVPSNYLEWFYGTIPRSKTETLLMCSENENGAFLICRSEKDTGGYVISVKSWTPVRHFKVLQDKEKKYHFEASQHFFSLMDLVNHFIDCFSVSLEEESLYVALWDFEARQQEEEGQEGEVSFQRGDQFKVLGCSEECWKVQKIDQNGKVLSSEIVPCNYLERAESLEAQP
uniref:non-specific protein-tyrosine kinase n=1 Tax=Periophthalmus magnuspinnatus TaxID=409849 RepID=A0A3B4B363_9GOBI